MVKKEKPSEFAEGALVAVGIMFRMHDNGVECKDLMKAMDLFNYDCSGLDEFDKENLKALSDYENLNLYGV